MVFQVKKEKMPEVYAHEDWPWFEAIYYWSHLDSRMLQRLIIRMSIPDKFRPEIAEIISGQKKPAKKAAAIYKRKKLTLRTRLNTLIRLHYICRYLDNITEDHLGNKDFIKEEKMHAYKKTMQRLDVTRQGAIYAYTDFLDIISPYDFLSNLIVKKPPKPTPKKESFWVC